MWLWLISVYFIDLFKSFDITEILVTYYLCDAMEFIVWHSYIFYFIILPKRKILIYLVRSESITLLFVILREL